MPMQLVDPPSLSSVASPRWLSPFTIVLACAVVAVLLSTQYLFQAFVWRHWPWDEVLAGWLEVARDRLVVALMIGLALVVASRIALPSLRTRSAVLAAAIVTGAVAGEFALLWAGAPGAPSDAAAVTARIARWSVVAGSVAALSYLWRRAIDNAAEVQSLELRRVQLERQATAAQLAALRVQIEPHFLFNTLATVRRLHQTEPTQGALLLDHFVNYLASSQPGSGVDAGTVAQEISLTRAYLGVVNARMAGRLHVTFEVDEALAQLPFPPLTIATLVENAIKHGIAPMPAGGAIAISVKAVGGLLEAVVADTGAGFVGSSGSGIGLANIRARLQTLYGSAGTLQLRANQPNGVCASIRMPLAT